MNRVGCFRLLLIIVVPCVFCSGCVLDPESDIIAGIADGNLPPYVVDGQFEPIAMERLVSLESLGVEHENLVLKTRQDKTVFGWFLPADDPVGTVLIHHGAVTNRSSSLSISFFLHLFGYNVVVYDYQGFGESESEVDLDTILADADAALEWLQRCDYAGTDRIVLYGVSLGTLPTIAQAAASPDDVVGMIVEGSFTTESLPVMSYFLIGLLPWARGCAGTLSGVGPAGAHRGDHDAQAVHPVSGRHHHAIHWR